MGDIPKLMDEYPILCYPSLAKALGVNHALVFQQLHFLLAITKKTKQRDKLYNFVDGKWWVYNTAKEWEEDHFPWLHKGTIARIFRDLEKKGLVLSMQSVKNPSDRTKWYTIDYAAWDAYAQTITTKCDDGSSHQIVVMEGTKCDDGYTETTADTTHSVKHIAGTNNAPASPPSEVAATVSEWGEVLNTEPVTIPIQAKDVSRNGKQVTRQTRKPPRDPLLDNPAVIAYREAAHNTPNQEQRAAIARLIDDIPRWQQVLSDWMLHGWNPRNVAGMLEKYRSESPSIDIAPVGPTPYTGYNFLT